MRRWLTGLTGLAVAGVLLLGGAAPVGAAASPPGGLPPQAHAMRVCAPVATGMASCHALVRTDVRGPGPSRRRGPGPTPPGYGPNDLRSAYNLASATAGAGQTVAIVDAYDDPRAETDLGVYRTQFGLTACTTANGCFRKVNQSGGTSYPVGNIGWAEEVSLDLDMVSAICPNCHILLVEASSNSLADLSTAEDTAARLGAAAISNSWGSGEYSAETITEADHFHHPGVAITASTGDGGYGVEFPAASQYVTAVGGTTLNKAGTTRGWSDTVWSGAGSGCSAYEPALAWQTTNSACPNNREVGDVAAIADPNTGVAVYDTYATTGWLVFGGTSVASPIIAGVYALAGNAASVTAGSSPYGHTSSLYDITSGSNGPCGTYLCNGEAGYDGPTGEGTPNGPGAF
jgi:subtilase family serine protease